MTVVSRSLLSSNQRRAKDRGRPGLFGLSRRFWAFFLVGTLLVLFDAFDTLGFLSAGWVPVAGHPGLYERWGEANPVMRAAFHVSPALLILSHAAVVLAYFVVCWAMTRERVIRRLFPGRPNPFFARLGVPRGEAMVRTTLWIALLALVLEFGALADLRNVLVSGIHLWPFA